MGHLTETDSNDRLKLAGHRHIIGQLIGVDMSQMFSPERVTAVCKQYGLVPGQAMDFKNGVDFDLARGVRINPNLTLILLFYVDPNSACRPEGSARLGPV